jgi:hypothetical protein
MTEPTQPQTTTDPAFYGVVGNVASDWALLEYLVNKCIWRAALVDDQLGACITAQIFSFQSRLEALSLLLRARQASVETLGEINKFISDARHVTDLRNRAVHDCMGIEGDEHKQLQITAKGKLVFDMRTVILPQIEKDRDEIDRYIDRFINFSNRVIGELSSLPYMPTQLFLQITRIRGEILTSETQ